MKRNDLIINPTGKAIRSDDAGSGDYGAPRGSRIHKGIDFICTPGQKVYCPINNAFIVRKAYPYRDMSYNGLLIKNELMEVMMFYLLPTEDIIGTVLGQNDVLGVAEDVSARYVTPMIPHIHLEIVSIDPKLFMQGD